MHDSSSSHDMHVSFSSPCKYRTRLSIDRTRYSYGDQSIALDIRMVMRRSLCLRATPWTPRYLVVPNKLSRARALHLSLMLSCSLSQAFRVTVWWSRRGPGTVPVKSGPGWAQCRGLRGAACAGKGKSGWLFFPGTFSCVCPSGATGVPWFTI